MGTEQAALKNVKIAILSSYTLKNITPFLTEKLSSKGFNADIRFGGYNQFIQEMIDQSSWLYEFQPDIVFLALNSKTFLEDIELDILDKSKKDIDALVAQKIEFLTQALNGTGLTSKIIVTSLEPFGYSPYGLTDIWKEDGLYEAVTSFNKKLIDLKRGLKNMEILDFGRFCLEHGKTHVFDDKMYFLGKILLSQEGAEKLADELSVFVNASYGQAKKVLVVDLDNTLWKGVVGEDGPQGIVVGEGAIGEIYAEVQKILLNYKKMGALLAIASKNNENDALEAFRVNKNMILTEEDFIVKKINWQPKSLNIQEMAQELNLGIDSFVFLDDNPAERLEVKTALPQVEVIDFPNDISYLPQTLKNMPYFKSFSLTEEDKKRHELYLQEVKRTELKKTYSIEEYLGNLGTSIQVKWNDIHSIERITQLINKTNQFNLRTQRYTLEQVDQMMKSDDSDVVSVTVKDKFGELGLTGVVIVKKEADAYFIDNFLLSCRILSRQIEKQFLHEVIKKLETDKAIRAEFIQSPKNQQVREFYDRFGFDLTKESETAREYRKDLKDLKLEDVQWIQVEHE